MDATEPGEAEQHVRVFLLDDHEVVRRGVRDLLEAEPDIEVVGEAATCAQALARVPALRPRWLSSTSGCPTVTVCRELRDRMPELICLMLTSFDDDDALLDAIMAGAAGYVLKQVKGADLVGAVRTVAAGQSMLDPATTRKLMESLRHHDETDAEAALHQLTPREREILALVGDGKTNRQIGQELYLAEKTVKNHVSRILAKLGVERRLQAAVMAAHVEPEHHGHRTH